MTPLTRRSWIFNLLRTGLAVALAWMGRPARAVAREIDYFTGTDWVGKNRSARFERFYINYWQPMRRVNPKTWSLTVTGFAFDEIARRVMPLPGANGVVFHCADEYVEYLSLETLRHPHTLLVTRMDGAPLPDEHGFPLRVIAPMKYGYKNPKAIVKMEFVAEERWGTWSKIGPYSADGTILPGTDHPLDLGKSPRRIPGGEITGY